MEKVHKSKIKKLPHVHTPKAKPADLSAVIDEIVNEKISEEKKAILNNLHNEAVKEKFKKKNEKSNIPYYILVGAILFAAFVIGGLSAKFVVPKFLNRTTEKIVTEVPLESTSSADKEDTSGPNSGIILTTPPPHVSAKAYGIFRLNNGEYEQLTTKNPEITLPLASVTKVMTAIVAMEEYDLDKPVVVPEKCVAINGSSVGFKANDVLSLQDMLYGLLVKSGADAACSIANIDNQEDFIALMNKRAEELGMPDTKFTNVVGFDNGDTHVSNVNDLKKMVSYALKFSSFRKIVGTEEIILTSKSNGAVYKIRNTNDLLFSIPGTVGVKTGYTDSAGECLAYLYQNKTEEILIIILGSEDRFGDTSKLLEWAKTQLDSNSPQN